MLKAAPRRLTKPPAFRAVAACVIGALVTGMMALAAGPAAAVEADKGWRAAAEMHTARKGHTATMLRDGRVLVVGGLTSTVAVPPDAGLPEIYTPPSASDPEGKGSWTQTTPPLKPRVTGHTSTLLWGPECGAEPEPAYCGKVLVVGGGLRAVEGQNEPPTVSTAEIYDPVNDIWEPAPAPQIARFSHMAVALNSGKVLVAGGISNVKILGLEKPVKEAEVFDPAGDNGKGTWTRVDDLKVPRWSAIIVKLKDGRVLVTGGLPARLFPDEDKPNLSEIFNPTAVGTNAPDWSFTGSMKNKRSEAPAVLLPGGQVIVEGGPGTEIYHPDVPDPDPDGLDPDPNTELFGTWLSPSRLPVAAPAPSTQHPAAPLPDGRVLFIRANMANKAEAAEIYDPGSFLDGGPAWESVGPLPTYFRNGATATLLESGEVLVVGGYSSSTGPNDGFVQKSADLYNPPLPKAKLNFDSPLNEGKLDYGRLPAGQTRSSKTISVTNEGKASLTIWRTTIQGDHPTDFGVTKNSCIRRVAPGQSCDLEVSFSPIASGQRAARLILDDSDPGTAAVALSGVGNDINAPSPPQELSATAAGGLAELNWKPATVDGGPAISGYRIYRGTASGDQGATPIATLGSNSRSYSDTSVQNVTAYFYRVTAFNSVGEGLPSNEAIAKLVGPPTVPLALSLRPSWNSIAVTWTPPSSDGGSPVTGYKVYRRTTESVSGPALRTLPTTSYLDTSAVNDTEFFYRVSAVNAKGEGPRSAEVSATPGPLPPSAPTNLKAEDKTGGEIQLSWAGADDGAGGKGGMKFNVYRGTAPGKQQTAPINPLPISTPNYMDKGVGVREGESYFYKVTAVTNSGESPFSNEAFGATTLWRAAAPMNARRAGHTSTTLGGDECKGEDKKPYCGQVLVVGGEGTIGEVQDRVTSQSSPVLPSEVYIPPSGPDLDGDWILRPGPSIPRVLGHSATALKDGRVLVAGGAWRGELAASGPGGVPDHPSNPAAASLPEIYDPETGEWKFTAPPISSRSWHSAVLLDDGRVLVTGGLNDLNRTPVPPPTAPSPSTSPSPKVEPEKSLPPGWDPTKRPSAYEHPVPKYPLETSEIYDPVTDKWTPAGTLNDARYGATAVRLEDGRVLIAAGLKGPVKPNALPASGSATRCPGGVATDGKHICGTTVTSAEIFDPGGFDPARPHLRGKWSLTGSSGKHRFAQAALLPGGKVLLAGGGDADRKYTSADCGTPARCPWAEVFDPAKKDPSTNRQGAWGPAEVPSIPAKPASAPPRTDWTTATALRDGRVLIKGSGSGDEARNRVYDPGSLLDDGPAWETSGTDKAPPGLSRHAASSLATNEMLVTGGDTSYSVCEIGGGCNAMYGPKAAAYLYDPKLPSADLDRESVAEFPGTQVGQTSAETRIVTMNNPGDRPLSISAVTVTGDAPSDYVISEVVAADGAKQPFCPKSRVPAKGQCQVAVTFKPTGGGPRPANLTFHHNDPGGERNVGLSGTGVGTGRPTAPAEGALTAAAAAGEISLSWSPASAGGSPVTGYRVYRGTSPGAQGLTPVESAVTGTSYVDKDVEYNTRYFYRVSAVNSAGEGAKSAEVAATTLPLVADLSVDLSVDNTSDDNTSDPKPVTAGSPFTYTIAVSNKGPDDAKEATLAHKLPEGVEFKGYSSAAAVSCKHSSGTVICKLGDLSPPTPESVEIEVTAREPGVHLSTATVGSRSEDPDVANNTSTASNTVAPKASDKRGVSIADAELQEGQAGTDNMRFTVSQPVPATQPVTFGYQTGGGTATSGVDYTPAPPGATATIPLGAVSTVIEVPIKGDALYGSDEDFTVTLSSSDSSVSFEDSQARGIIRNDDLAPTLSVAGPVPVKEGNSGSTPANFTITQSLPSEIETQFAYETLDGTAKAGSDYTPAAQGATATIAPGSTSATVAVPVTGDTMLEAPETFSLKLTSAQNAQVAPAPGDQAAATIENDDSPPSVSVNDLIQAEGSAANTTMNLTVRLSAPSYLPVTVGYRTALGTATAGEDYTPVSSGSVTIQPGDSTGTAAVSVTADKIYENNETFYVDLFGPSGGTLGDARATGVIVNDDVKPSLRIGDARIAEGNAGATTLNFPVTLSEKNSFPTTFTYSTLNGTATGGSDFTTKTGSITIPAGQTTATVSVSLIGDTVVEQNETFSVKMAIGSNTPAVIGDSTGVGTILNDDPPAIRINDVSTSEGPSGYKTATFTVSLSAPMTSNVTVRYTTVPGTATAGVDYSSKSGTLSILAGRTSNTVSVSVRGDTVVEQNETFFLDLSSPVGATIADSRGQMTILNDDPPPIRINDVSITEVDSGYSTLTFTVSMSAPMASNVTVNYATVPGTATAGVDYSSKSGTLTILAGRTSNTVSVSVRGDAAREANETFFLDLSSPVNATIADARGQATIVNDD